MRALIFISGLALLSACGSGPSNSSASTMTAITSQSASIVNTTTCSKTVILQNSLGHFCQTAPSLTFTQTTFSDGSVSGQCQVANGQMTSCNSQTGSISYLFDCIVQATQEPISGTYVMQVQDCS